MTAPTKRCDFCEAQGPAAAMRAYPCSDFVTQTVIRDRMALGISCWCHPRIDIRPGDQVIETPTSGAWIACPTCQGYIERDDRTGLVAHVEQSTRDLDSGLPMYVVNPMTGTMQRAPRRAAVKVTLDMFWRHRLPEN